MSKDKRDSLVSLTVVVCLLVCAVFGVMAFIGPAIGNVFSTTKNSFGGGPPLPHSDTTAQTSVMVASPNGNGVFNVNAAAIDRRIIKNSQLTCAVENVDTTIARLTSIAVESGGYVVSTRTYADNNRKGGTVVMAVPVEQFEGALNRVRQTAQHIENDSVSSSDVTEQYVDLQARLQNLEATAERVRSFLAKAKDADESLKVGAQLSQVEEQIEAIKGKLNLMTLRTTFSTITVDLRESVPPAASPLVSAWYPERTFQTALTLQANLLRGLGDLLIWLAIVVLPYAVMGAVVVGVVRWLRHRNKQVVRH